MSIMIQLILHKTCTFYRTHNRLVVNHKYRETIWSCERLLNDNKQQLLILRIMTIHILRHTK